MITFTGKYGNGSYSYDYDSEVIRQSLLAEMNFPRGYRIYYPDYGSLLSTYEFSLADSLTVSRVFMEMKRVIESYDGMKILSYTYEKIDRVLKYQFIVQLNSNKFELNFNFSDGVVS